VTALHLPVVQRDSAARDDGSHGAQGENPIAVFGDDDLLPGRGVPPLLMAPGLPNQFESVTSQDRVT
jgi:hypothetical protein